MTYKLLSATLGVIARIPFAGLYVLSDGLGFMLYHVVRYRRKVVRRNLTECFPDKSIAEIKRIERGFYRWFTDNILESIKMARMSPSEMRSHMRFPNISEVNDVLHSGRSVALFIGHHANWEWQSSMPLHLPDDVVAAQIYHKLKNEAVDRLMYEVRGRMGATSVEMRQTARFITQQRREGRECIVGFIADQSPRRSEVRDFVEFLNHRAPALTGVEKIAKHYGWDAWFVRTRRVKRGFYEAEFVRMHPAPETAPDFELTEIYYRMLEEAICDSPELYLWSHNRFKFAELLPSDKKDSTDGN